MRKILVFLTLFSLFLSLPGLALAAGNNVEVKKGQVINHDFYNAGENVTISGTVNGDVFVAGANVLVDGTVNGDLFAVGATVTVLGSVSDDVRAAASSVLIKGTVGKNVTAFGSSVTLSSEGRVGGSLLAAANTVDLGGPVAKDVMAFGNQVLLTSTVGRDFQGMMQNLVLGSGAKILGNLTYQSSREINVPAGTVGGKVTYQPAPKAQNTNVAAFSTGLVLAPLFMGLKIFFNFIGLIFSLVLGLIYFSLFPKRAQGIVDTLGSKPWPSLGVGLLTLILFPAVVVILTVSLVGIPLLLILVPLFLFFLYMAKIFTAFYLGRRLLSRQELFWPLLAGLAVYFIFGLIPFIGGLTTFVFITLGLGAFVLDLKSLRQ